MPVRHLLASALLFLCATCGVARTFSVWAPGVINPAEGAIELDVEFLRPASEMRSDWRFILQASGNSPGAGNTMLAIVVCPPSDARGFLGLAKGNAGTAYASVAPVPEFPVGGVRRVALLWGGGYCDLWFDGVRVGRGGFGGGLAALPPRFTLGAPGYFSIKAARVSSARRGDAELAGRHPLAPDAQTTWHAADDGEESLGATVWQHAQFRAGVFPDRAAASFVASEGEPLVVPLRTVNFTGSPAIFSLAASMTDRHGAASGNSSATVTVAAGARYGEAAFSLPAIDRPGYHEAAIAITSPAGSVETHRLGFVVRPAGEVPAGRLAGYLGHHHPFQAKPDAYSSLGIAWHRAWASERSFLWHAVEPAPGDFQWDEADRALAAAEANGIRTLGLLGNPPAWASTFSPAERERVAVRSVAAYTDHPDRYQPRDIAEWKNYVRAVVTRYRGRVSHWEIGNEIDFHPPFLHASFSGTTGDYAALLAAAREVIREVDPEARVLTAGFSLTRGVTDVGMPAELMRLCTACSFDILAVHAYADRATLAETIGAVRAAKPGVPLWQTEREYMGEARDDYQAIHSLFWCLQRGFEHYFLHEADLDKNFGRLNPTPLYAVTSEAARQLRAADALDGSVPGAPERLASWRLRRADGRHLQVFAADNGRFTLDLDGLAPDDAVEVTNLYGELLHRGPLPDGRLVVEDLVYVVSPASLRITRSERERGQIVANPGFEIREGDITMDESAARPASWLMRPEAAAPAALSFSAGRTGNYAVIVDGAKAGAPRPHIVQRVQLDEGGPWRLSGWVRAPVGEAVPARFYLQVGDGRWPSAGDARIVPGDGEWRRLTFDAEAPASGARAYVLIGVESGAGLIAIDDIELEPVTP